MTTHHAAAASGLPKLSLTRRILLAAIGATPIAASPASTNAVNIAEVPPPVAALPTELLHFLKEDKQCVMLMRWERLLILEWLETGVKPAEIGVAHMNCELDFSAYQGVRS